MIYTWFLQFYYHLPKEESAQHLNSNFAPTETISLTQNSIKN